MDTSFQIWIRRYSKGPVPASTAEGTLASQIQSKLAVHRYSHKLNCGLESTYNKIMIVKILGVINGLS